MPRSAFLPFGEYPSPEVLKTLFVFKDSIGDVIDLRDLVQKETEAFPIYRGIAILSIFFCAIGVHAVLQFAGKRVERGVDDVDGFVERITQRGEALSFLRGQSQILHDVLYSSSGCYADLIGIHLSQKIRLSSDRRYFFAASLPSSIRASLRRDLRDRTGKFGLFQISETAGLPHDRFELLFSAMQVGTRSTAGVATAAEEFNVTPKTGPTKGTDNEAVTVHGRADHCVVAGAGGRGSDSGGLSQTRRQCGDILPTSIQRCRRCWRGQMGNPPSARLDK